MYVTNDLERTIKEVIFSNNIMISGAPGVGKSEIVEKVCKNENLKHLEVRLYEQGDTAVGLPRINGDILEFSKPWWIHQLEVENIDVLFLDDFHLVQPGIQKFLYRLLSSRMVHNWKLNDNLKIILAGNFNIDSASASMIQSPIMGRIDVMVEYKPSIDNFINWASESDRIDFRIIAFLRANPELLYEDDPAPTVKYPSPRTWEQLSKNIARLNKPDYAQAIIGDRAGAIFEDFWEMLSTSPEEILKSGEPSNDIKDQVVAAIILAQYTKDIIDNDDKLSKVLKYINKMNPDSLFLYARSAFKNIGHKFLLKIKNNEDGKNVYVNLLELSSKL